MEVGEWLVWMEWHPAWWSVCLPLLSSLVLYSPEDFFWHRLTWVVPEKGLKWLHVCVSVNCLMQSVVELLIWRVWSVYHCGCSSAWSSLFTFVAMPNSPDWGPRFAVFGDMGNINAKSVGRLEEETQEGHFDAVLHVGTSLVVTFCVYCCITSLWPILTFATWWQVRVLCVNELSSVAVWNWNL